MALAQRTRGSSAPPLLTLHQANNNDALLSVDGGHVVSADVRRENPLRSTASFFSSHLSLACDTFAAVAAALTVGLGHELWGEGSVHHVERPVPYEGSVALSQAW